MPVIGPVLQIVAAILIVILLFCIGFFIYNMEILNAIKDTGRIKKSVNVFTGMIDVGNNGGKGVSFDTVNPKSPMYRDIAPSVNQASGAEFSYNFWLYKDNELFQTITESGSVAVTDEGLTADDYILFVHGDKNVTTYKSLCNTNTKTDIMVKCPLVKLERGGHMLTVELNTLGSRDAVHEQSRNTCTDNSRNWMDMNAHKIAIYMDHRNPNVNYDKKWFMVTLIVNDTTPSDPIPLRNKVRCRLYINGVLELDRYIDDRLGVTSSSFNTQSVLRRNTGNLHVGPKVAIDAARDTKTNRTATTDTTNKLIMSDLKYFNYAVTEAEIKNMLKDGFSKDWAPILTSTETPAFSATDSVSVPGNTRSFTAL